MPELEDSPPKQWSTPEMQVLATLSLFEKLKTKWPIVVVVVLGYAIVLGGMVYTFNKREQKVQPTPTTIPSPTPTVEITPIPTPVSIDISNLELQLDRKEYLYSGIGSDGAVIDVSRYYFKNNSSELISSVEEQLNKNNWVITDILDQRNVEEKGWWRIFAKKEEPNLKVTLTVNKQELFIVEEWHWGKMKFSYPVDFPAELKTETLPRWIVMGVDSSGRKMTQVEYANFAQAAKELSPDYLASHGWWYGSGAPGVDGYMKYDKELIFFSCPTNYAPCLNELKIVLKTKELKW